MCTEMEKYKNKNTRKNNKKKNNQKNNIKDVVIFFKFQKKSKKLRINQSRSYQGHKVYVSIACVMHSNHD